MEANSGFIAGTTGVFDERGQVLEVESDLYCIRPVSSDERCALEVPAGDFNVVLVCEEVVGDVVDGDAVDSDECILRPSSKGACEIDNVFDCGWVGIIVTGGRDLRQAIWSLDVEVEGVMLVALRY